MTKSQWIEQADREAAAAYMKRIRDPRWSVEGILNGGCDNTSVVIAFARHRQQAVAAERERCAKILKARASHLRTPEGCISAQWHSNDAFMVAGELERQAEAIRQMKDTNDDR